MGFADRLNDTFRGAGVALQAATLRQRLLESQQAYEATLRVLGEKALERYSTSGPDAIDHDLQPLAEAASSARAVMESRSAELGVLEASLTLNSVDGPRFCVACGAKVVRRAGSYCITCGSELK